MMQYTNAFLSAMNENGREFMITFLQESPALKEDGSMGKTCETVAGIVMNDQIARQLISNLQELLDQNESAE